MPASLSGGDAEGQPRHFESRGPVAEQIGALQMVLSVAFCGKVYG
jgi:hypothetical protein